jgi:hypothetical protein
MGFLGGWVGCRSGRVAVVMCGRAEDGGIVVDLEVVRLLQNPLGQEAPFGHPGDIVRVSDGQVALYLFPREFDAADESRLRWLLAERRTSTDAPHG